jgi:hypothetical protein
VEGQNDWTDPCALSRLSRRKECIGRVYHIPDFDIKPEAPSYPLLPL